MIEGHNFIWLHLPKCAGHTVEMALRAGLLGRSDVRFDRRFPEFEGWHDGLAARRCRDKGFDPTDKRIIAGFRRLPHWILSRAHFEVARAPHHCATREMICRGEYFENGGEVSSADALLSHYAPASGGLPGVHHWIRAEHLHQDFWSAFQDIVGIRRPIVEWQLRRTRNPTRIDYVKTPSFHFTRDELAELYARNPVWATVERRLYGSTLDEPAEDAQARQVSAS